MKFRLLFFPILMFSLFLFQPVHAQYITPGNNLSLSLDGLVSTSGGVVTLSGGTYFINSALTISATDTLKITNPAVIRVAAAIRIEVSGTIISDPSSGTVVFTAIDTTTASTNFRGFRFDNSQGNIFRNTTISYGGGLQLISSGALFEYCTFRRNGSSNVSAAITYSSSSPVIRYNYFIENVRSAIGSGANVTGSPLIMYNVLINNTTDNSNRPQINIGPGAADTLYIVGNYVEGLYPVAGGIGISNLLATGSTKAVIRDNFVVNNRYGFAQIGSNISSIIADNIFLDNNTQNNPALGGSGINFQASGTGNTAIVRRNIISGNLWGITIQGVANPNLGTADNPGGNVFYDNGNTGAVYAVYNNTALPVNAIGNYWGTNDPVQVEDYIFHQPDQASLGLVTYLPIQTLEPEIESFGFLMTDNPALPTDIFGVIDQVALTIDVTLPAGTDVTSLIPQIGIPLGVITEPVGGEPIDFSDPVSFTVLTPHGQNAVYTVNVMVEPFTYSLNFNITSVGGQPINNAVITLNGTAYPAGQYLFENLLAGNYAYTITHPEYITAEGTAAITDQNLSINVVLVPMSYNVTFDVKDNNGVVLPDAIVTFDGTSYTAGFYVFPNVLPGTYPYSVSRNGYETVSGNAVVTNQHVVVEVVLQIINYTVTFDVKDNNGVVVPDAIVTFNGTAYSAGFYVFPDVLPGTYPYSVSRNGYESASGNVVVTNQNVLVQVQLQIIAYVVTIKVDDNYGFALVDANVALQNYGTQTTNFAGKAYFYGVVPGIYAFEITKTGYATYNGTLEVVNADVDLSVVVENITSLNESKLDNIVFYPNPAVNFITVEGMPSEVKKISFVDISGKVLMQVKNLENGQRISLESLPKGKYQIIFETASGRKSASVIIQ
ncbi:MAG: T9SS type A sorting domain-containing protein [Bacteroidales bacterium]|nr:T9SS type A sorting domain-containing protein [Bacteroidales bacterium]